MFFVVVNNLSKLISGYFISVHLPFLYSLRELLVRFTIFFLLLVFVKVGVFKAAWIYVIAALLGLSVNLLFFFRHFSFFRYKCLITGKFVKKLFRFSTPLVVKDFFGTFMGYADNLVLVYFRPLTEVAIYNVVLPTAELLLFFCRPFSNVMFPLTSELWALNEKKKILFLLRMVHKHILLFLVPLGTMIYFFSKLILEIIFGADYAGGSLALKILTVGLLIAGLNIVSSSVLMGLGRSKEIAKISISTNIINLALNIVLIPLFGKFFNQGYLGAIVATVFAFFVSFLWLFYYLRKFLTYLPPFRDFLKIFVSGFFAFTVGYIFLKNILNIYIQMGVFVFVTLIFYFLFLILLEVTSKKEIKKIIKVFFKKKVV